MRITLRTFVVLLFALTCLSGCSDHGGGGGIVGPGGGTTADETLVTQTLAQNPAILDDGLSANQSAVDFATTSGLVAVRPITFWRSLSSTTRTFDFAFSDSDTVGRPRVVVVTITTHQVGTLNLIASVPSTDGNPADSTRQLFQKPLDEQRVRRVQLVRTALALDHNVLWRVARVSGVEVTSASHTTQIQSVHVQTTGVDTTFTDPLALARVSTFMQVQPSTSVQLTVTTSRADDIVVLVLFDRRFRLTNNGDGTYTGTFRTGSFVNGLRHFGVFALSHGTLFDSQAAYDAMEWVLPFVVAPTHFTDPGEVGALSAGRL